MGILFKVSCFRQFWWQNFSPAHFLDAHAEGQPLRPTEGAREGRCWRVFEARSTLFRWGSEHVKRPVHWPSIPPFSESRSSLGGRVGVALFEKDPPYILLTRLDVGKRPVLEGCKASSSVIVSLGSTGWAMGKVPEQEDGLPPTDTLSFWQRQVEPRLLDDFYCFKREPERQTAMVEDSVETLFWPTNKSRISHKINKFSTAFKNYE